MHTRWGKWFLTKLLRHSEFRKSINSCSLLKKHMGTKSNHGHISHMGLKTYVDNRFCDGNFIYS